MVAVIKVKAKELNERLLKKIKRLVGEEKNTDITISIHNKKDFASDQLLDEELRAWKNAGAIHFLKGYSQDEPEYFEADIKEPNPEYKAWKKAK